MKQLDLFSGFGGFALAAYLVWLQDYELAAFCEKDPTAQKALSYEWPHVPIIKDIYDLDGKEFSDINLLTAGWPCQPFSTAGLRRGEKDDRYLWPEVLRVLKETSSTWFVGENVPQIITDNGGVEINRVLSDLEGIGYRTIPPFILPACSVNAPHLRKRVWIVAYSTFSRRNGLPVTSINKKGTRTVRATDSESITNSSNTAHRSVQRSIDYRTNTTISNQLLPAFFGEHQRRL